MRSPVILLTICLAACVQHCGGLRNRAATDAMIEQAQSPNERQERRAGMRRWILSSLVAAVQKGEEFTSLLFGTGAGGGGAEMLSREEDGLAPSCSEKDGVAAKAAGVEWMGIIQALSKEMTSELGPLASADGQPATIDIGNVWTMQKAGAKAMKHLMQKAPGACKDLQTAKDLMDGDLGGMLTCVHQATNVSKKCLRCVPRFVNQVSSECSVGCVTGLMQARKEMLKKLEPAISKIMPSPAEALGAPPTHKDAVKRAKVLQDLMPEVFKSLSVVAPCVQCARKRTDHLMDCLNLESTVKEDVDATIKQIEDELRDGTLVTVNITGIDTEVPEPEQRRAPMVPLQ